MIDSVSILLSSNDHPVRPFIEAWQKNNVDRFNIEVASRAEDLDGGDILFLISCLEILNSEVIKKYKAVLVIHASDLPKGRGFSPHIWDIINGREIIYISLIEASEKVDRGDIWKKISRKIPKSMIYEEIIEIINSAHLELMDFAVDNFYEVNPIAQDSRVEPTYYPRRNPENSELDIDKSLRQQFDLLRVCDPKRFPAFFSMHGRKFKITIEDYEK